MKRTYQSLSSFAAVGLAAFSCASTVSASTIYVDDVSILYKYSTGTPPVSTVFSSAAARFDNGLALNNLGVLFAATESGLYSYSSAGVATQFAAGDDSGIAIDSAGNVYTGVTTARGTNLEKFTPSSSAPPTATVVASGVSVDSLAFDANGNLFEADDSGFIYEYLQGGGTPITFASGLDASLGYNFFGLAIDNSGNVFVSYQNGLGGGIEKFSAAGRATNFASYAGTSVGTDISPEGLAYDSQSNELYLTWINDGGSGDVAGVYAFSPAGSQSVFATGLTSPTGIALNATPEPASLSLLLISLVTVPFLKLRKARAL